MPEPEWSLGIINELASDKLSIAIMWMTDSNSNQEFATEFSCWIIFDQFQITSLLPTKGIPEVAESRESIGLPAGHLPDFSSWIPPSPQVHVLQDT
jgi:hypothetical protein